MQHYYFSTTTRQTEIFTGVFIIFVDKLPPPPVNNNIAAAARRVFLSVYIYIYIPVSLYNTIAVAGAAAVGR